MTDSSTVQISESKARQRSEDVDQTDYGLEKVLLPVGPSEEERLIKLANTVSETAGMMQMSVHVLHVFTESRFEDLLEQLNYDQTALPDPDTVVQRVRPVRRVTRVLHPAVREWGVTMSVEGRVSNAVGAEIIAVAEDIDAKRIVVGGRRRTPTGKAIFGSTAQEILLDAPCPVTFVRDS